MNREIKFRAWMPNEGTWYRGGAVQIIAQVGNSFGLSETNRKIVELEQYTGLTDKRGREIYEGEIVSTPGFRNGSPERVFAIEWKSIANHTSVGAGSHNMEVVGNTHDNPELLSEIVSSLLPHD